MKFNMKLMGNQRFVTFSYFSIENPFSHATTYPISSHGAGNKGLD